MPSSYLTKIKKMNINSKTVLITGGGSGIGLSIAKALLAKGAKVIICSRNLEKLKKVKVAHPELEIEQCDVTDTEQIQNLLTVIQSKYNGIDILINNAGVVAPVDYTKPIHSFDSIEKEIDIDFTALLRMVHYFLPILLKRESAAIINVSSVLAFSPYALVPTYCACKAAVHSWSQSLRFQLRKTNIKVFELMPPLVDTPMIGNRPKPKGILQPETVANELVNAILNNKYEITPKQASRVKLMKRLAPNFLFNKMNK